MFTIQDISREPERLEEAIRYFWSAWGNERNYSFYADSIRHSLDPSVDLPRFYIALEDSRIIGSPEAEESDRP